MSNTIGKNLSFQPTQLKAFLTVVELGSLRAAADQLGVSPAAVSSSLASLRHAVGVPLFAREGRGVRSHPGGIVLRRGRAANGGAVGRVHREARTSMRDTRVPLRIGAVAAAAEAFLADALAQFMVEAPEVPVELEVVRREALWNLIEERKVDIGFAEMPPIRTTLQLLAIRREMDFVVAEPARVCAAARRGCARSVWLLREPGSGMRAATEEFHPRIWHRTRLPRHRLGGGDSSMPRRQCRRLAVAARHDRRPSARRLAPDRAHSPSRRSRGHGASLRLRIATCRRTCAGSSTASSGHAHFSGSTERGTRTPSTRAQLEGAVCAVGWR